MQSVCSWQRKKKGFFIFYSNHLCLYFSKWICPLQLCSLVKLLSLSFSSSLPFADGVQVPHSTACPCAGHTWPHMVSDKTETRFPHYNVGKERRRIPGGEGRYSLAWGSDGA